MGRFEQQLVRREGKSWRRQGGVPLCNVCGVQEGCELRGALSVLGQARGAEVAVPSCTAYLPVIGFQDRAGVEGRFNTFRRGRGWARRLDLGVMVGLYDMPGDTLMGQARVVEIHVGKLGELLPPHAKENHLMKALPPGEAPAALQKVLRRLYGTTYGAPDQEFCVIVCEKEG